MIKTFQLLFVLISVNAFAQIKGSIMDSTTKEPIPYVNIWVEGDNNGTTADENGNFSLPETNASKSIVFSAVGYAKKSIKVTDASGILYLTPQAIEIEPVVIENRKDSKEITIGSLKDAEKHHYYGNKAGSPWIHANFFQYKTDYSTAPYLKTVKIKTDTEHKGASFNVRLYAVGKNGEPGDFLYDENIICYPKKGSRQHVIDFSKLNIRFPEDGFFIALEWLIIEQNRYEVVIKSRSDANGIITQLEPKDYEKYDSYTPAFGITYADKEIMPWIYVNGKWCKQQIKDKSTRNSGLAMELILSN